MKKTVGILISATLVLVVGISVAYYNTSSIGYDNANVLSVNDEHIRVFDYTIEYDDVRNKFEKVKNMLPGEYITI